MIDQHSDVRSPRHVTRLVVAPHAGDELPGFGGMLARHSETTMVVVLAELDTAHRERFATAQRILGHPSATLLDLPGRHLAAHLDQIVSLLADLVTRLRPLEIYLPYPAVHEDHLVAYEAGMRATRTSSTPQARAAVSVLVYDAGAVDLAAPPADIHWSVREPLSEADIDRKVGAAFAYRSPDARALKRVAREIGHANGVSWAEQFALLHAPRAPERSTPPTPSSDPVLAPTKC